MYEYSRAILNGTIPVDRLNDQVTRILAAWFQMGQVSQEERTSHNAQLPDTVRIQTIHGPTSTRIQKTLLVLSTPEQSSRPKASSTSLLMYKATMLK